MALQTRTFRGTVNLYTPEPFEEGGTQTLGNPMQKLGLAATLTLTPENTRNEVMEKETGNDSKAETWTTSAGGTLEITLDSALNSEIAIAMGGRARINSPKSVTAAKIAVKDGNKWKELTTTAALSAGRRYYFLEDLINEGLDFTAYDYIDTSTFVLTDSSGTPKELDVGDDYTINAKTGALVLKNTTNHGVNLPGITYPLKADFETGYFEVTMANPIRAGKVRLENENVTNVVIKDSSAPAKTIPDTNYEIDPEYGTITLTGANVTAIKAISGVTFPLKISGIRGTTTEIAGLQDTLITRGVYFEGFDNRTKQKAILDVFQAQFEMVPLEFFAEKNMQIPLRAQILRDISRPAGNQYFSFKYL